MTSSPAPYLYNTSKNKPPSLRDVGYYSQRLRHQVFARLTARFAELAEREGMTKAGLVRLTGKDAAQINRALAIPSNFTLDTISLLALAMGCEPEVVLHDLEEGCDENYIHPLMAPLEKNGNQSAGRNRTSVVRLMNAGASDTSASLTSIHPLRPLGVESAKQ